jgi:aspartate aminotransferase-like enzyme
MPPGISMVSAGERAWQASQKATMNKFYFSLHKARDFAEIGQTPFTPAISQMVAARTALELYFKEGREQSYARHRRMALAVRTAARALGLELLVEDRYASTTVTAIKKPESVNLREMLSAMRRLGVEISGGQGRLSDHTFRFGHLGAVDEMDIVAGLAALEIALLAQGFDLKPGAAVAAAREAIVSGRQSAANVKL